MYSTPHPFLKCALQFCGCRLTAEEASAAAATNIIDKKMLWRYSAEILAKQMWQARGQAKKLGSYICCNLRNPAISIGNSMICRDIYGINTTSDISKLLNA